MKRGHTVIKVRREPTWTGLGPTEVRIIQTRTGNYYVQGCKKVGDSEPQLGAPGDRLRTEAELNEAVVKALLARLAGISLPAFPEFPDGCDGEFTELECGGYAGKATYRWWSVPPPAWQDLTTIAIEIEALAHLESVKVNVSKTDANVG